MSHVSRTASFHTNTDGATPTFAAQAIGANGGSDSIYVFVFARNTSNPTHGSTALTIDGVAATLITSVSAWNGASGCVGALFALARNSLPDPTQTDVDLAVTWTASVLRTSGYVLISPDAGVTAGDTATDSDAGSSITTDVTQSLNLDTTASGIVIGCMFNGNAGTPDASLSFSAGLTDDGSQEAPGENVTKQLALANNVTPKTSRTITALFDHAGVAIADPISIAACFPGNSLDPLYIPTLHTDGTRMLVATPYLGPTTIGLRIMEPTAPEPVPHRLVFLLPVKPANNSDFGDGFTEFVNNDWHNVHNLTLIAPETPVGVEPWGANHPTDGDLQYESALVAIIEWAISEFGPGEVWAFGFSKGGLAALTLLFRHPDLIDRVGCFDAPITDAEVPDSSQAITATTFGDETNYNDNYDLLALLSGFIAAGNYTYNRMWISGWPTTYLGSPIPYSADMDDLHDALDGLSVPHTWDDSGTSEHYWDGNTTSGNAAYWLDPAIASLILSSGLITADVPAGVVTFSGVSPTCLKRAAVVAGSLTLTGVAPGTRKSAALTPGSLAFTGVAPSCRKAAAIDPGSVTLTGIPPTAAKAHSVPPGSLTFTGIAPTTPAPPSTAKHPRGGTFRGGGPQGTFREGGPRGKFEAGGPRGSFTPRGGP